MSVEPSISEPGSPAAKCGRDLEFEIAVGARIRAARIAARMTQQSLGDAAGITYQKLQKYERGKDRIAISTLQKIARALDLHPGSFFDGPLPERSRATVDLMVARRSIELVQAKPDPRVVRRMLDLMDDLGTEDLRSKGGTPSSSTPLTAERCKEMQARRAGTEPVRTLVDSLVDVLRGVGQGDTAALARMLGQALVEADRIVRSAM